MERAEKTLDDFKLRDMPRIAISVDMLDTRIDVPAIRNLVFAKPVFSKVKFWQMLGRGTRTWTDPLTGQEKVDFLVIDHWGVFDYFQVNKDGRAGAVAEPLPTRLFRLRLEKLQILAGRDDTESVAPHRRFASYGRHTALGHVKIEPPPSPFLRSSIGPRSLLTPPRVYPKVSNDNFSRKTFRCRIHVAKESAVVRNCLIKRAVNGLRQAQRPVVVRSALHGVAKKRLQRIGYRRPVANIREHETLLPRPSVVAVDELDKPFFAIQPHRLVLRFV
jgi:hypothetical protein